LRELFRIAITVKGLRKRGVDSLSISIFQQRSITTAGKGSR
jgi:hypothetical protein